VVYEGILLTLGGLDVQCHQWLRLRYLLCARKIVIRRQTLEILVLVLKLLGVEELDQDVVFATGEHLL